MSGADQAGADLTHVETWIFDLDETLYDRESGVLAEMEGRIETYLMQQTGEDAPAVVALRESMRNQYGSTLAALLAQGGADVEAYLAHVHDVPLDSLKPDPDLRTGLERLPGRRLIHTNAPGFHAERVLEALGIADLFESVFHCAAAEYVLKPHKDASDRMVAAYGLKPAVCAFFEDREANLAPAAARGMTTILTGPQALTSTASFIHHRAEPLAPFLLSARVRKEPVP
jgi:putative hydrolase of the HAD superfamily